MHRSVLAASAFVVAVGAPATAQILRALTVVGMVVSLCSPAAAQAESIRGSAERYAATVQPVGPEVRVRSWVRTWSGVGIAWAGVVVAASGTECRVFGEFQTERTRVYDSDIGWINLRYSGSDPVLDTNTCELDDFSISLEATALGYTVSDDVLASDAGSASDRAVVRSVQADVEGRRVPNAIMYSGLGIMAAGVLLATVWADVPAAESLSVTPLRGGGAVSFSIGF